MADKKVTQLTSLATPAGVDLLLVIDDPSGSPVSKKISLNQLFGSIPANTSISATFTVSGNTTLNGSNTVITSNVNMSVGPKITDGKITLKGKTNVTSNNATNQFGGGMQGTIAWDANYLYVATSNTVVKRVALSNFNS